MENSLRIAIVGGDERGGAEYPDDVEIRRFGSSRYAGNGSLRRLLSALSAGTIDAVVLLIRWMGHPASRSIRAACQRYGVPCSVVTGGESAARVAVLAIAEGS